MAESAVNISSLEHKKPNIFELVAQESLINHMYPAFKALCSYAANKNRTLFGPLLKRYEEVFLGLNFVLQYYYLKGFSSSFSEAFYGLRRIKAYSNNGKGRLPPKLFILSLVFLVLMPYINNKLQKLAIDSENEEAMEQPQDRKLRKLLKWRKFIISTYGVLRVYYLLSYTAGYARVHDPILKLSGVELIYHDRHMPSWRDIWRAFISSESRPKITLKLALKLMASTVEVGAFFIQFLNWWHSDESKRKLTRLPVPKPPHINTGTIQCPICLRKRKNEVVLLTSGYVFCYLCIKDYLDKKGMCPITNLPSSANNLLRIYSTDS